MKLDILGFKFSRTKEYPFKEGDTLRHRQRFYVKVVATPSHGRYIWAGSMDKTVNRRWPIYNCEYKNYSVRQ